MAGDGSMYAPIFIGLLINCILYGATVVQGVVYFQTFKSDKWWMKMFVFYLLVCETLNTAFDAGVIYEPFIINYGTSRVATHAPKMLATNPLMTVMISLPVQLFIAWRVKVMSKSNVLPAIISFFAIASFAGGIAVTVGVILIDFQYALFSKNYGAVITWLTASAAADIIITASLVRSLLCKRTGFAVTDDVINRIIRLTIQTGLLTAMTATLDITLFLVLKGKNWNFILDLALSKLYSNTILSSLNARGGWKAVSSVRDNVLFGRETGRESTTRSRTQIEIVTTVTSDVHSPRFSGAVPMKALDAGAGYGHDDSDSSVANIERASVEAI
ncbi:hypothetical protein EV363DRAFT_9184 [Boletus edulis]|nr:hypothetical protein EV363DRAFT_9184 [Boletus edulis]